MYDGRRGPILVVGKQQKYEEGVGEVGVDRRKEETRRKPRRESSRVLTAGKEGAEGA